MPYTEQPFWVTLTPFADIRQNNKLFFDLLSWNQGPEV